MGNTVQAGVGSQSIYNSHIPRVHYAAGRYWAFYWDNTLATPDAVFESTTDISTWTGSQTSIFDQVPQADNKWAVWFSGTTIWAICYSANPNWRYRKGTLQSDGTIDWGTADENTGTATAGSNQYLTIAIGSGGEPMFGFQGGTTVFEDHRFSGSWAGRTTTGIVGGSIGNTSVRAIGATDLMYMITSSVTGGAVADRRKIEGAKYNAGWASPEIEIIDGSTADQDFDNSGAMSFKCSQLVVLSDNSQAHLVYVVLDGDIQHVIYTVSTDSWGSPSEVVADTIDMLCLARDDSDNLYCFYVKNADQKIYYKKYTGTWGSEQVFDSGTAPKNGICCSHSESNSEILVLWDETVTGASNVVIGALSVGGAGGGGLFRKHSMHGMGVGGPFFINPLTVRDPDPDPELRSAA